MIDFKIVKEIGKIIRSPKTSIDLNIVKWDKNVSKYDLRKWKNGEPLKGLTFSKSEIKELYDILDKEVHSKEFNELATFELELSKSDIENLADDEPEEYVEENYEQQTIEDWLTDIDDLMENYEQEAIETSGDEDIMKDVEHESLNYNDLILCADWEVCDDIGHNVVDVIVNVRVFTGTSVIEVEIPTMYCNDCNIYYIDRKTYLLLTRKGRVLCQITTLEDYEKIQSQNRFGNLNQESILHMIGYTVNSKDNYSDYYRQVILEHAIEDKTIDAYKTIKFLSWLITQRKNMRNQEDAIKKWSIDRDYIISKYIK